MGQVVTNTTDLSTLAVGKDQEVDLKMRTPRWVKLYNASPFFLTVNTKNTEFHSLAPGEEDLYALEEATPVISVHASAQLNLQNPPATALVSTAYDQANQPSGNFPTFSNTFVAIGNVAPLNTVASELLSVSQQAGTEVIHVTNSLGVLLFQALNDGTLKIWEQSNGAISGTPFFQITPGGGAGVFATISFDFGLVVSDGQGNLTGNRFLANDRFRWIKALGGITQTVFDFSPPGAGKSWSLFYGADNSLRWNENTDGFEATRWNPDKSGTLSGGQMTWDASGNLSVPNLLEIAGQQETGHYHVQFVAPSTVVWVYWVAFRKQMTNTPANVTLSGTTLTNCTAAVAGITKTGFQLQLTPLAAGTVAFDGDYTTVGN